MGAADLSKIRWLSERSNTLGRRPEASWFAQTTRAQASEGQSRGESLGAEPGVTCFEGASAVLGPRPWDQDGKAQASSSLRSLQPRIPQSPKLSSTVGEGTQRVRQRTTASPPERTVRERTPGAAADLASPQGRRERNPSRG